MASHLETGAKAEELAAAFLKQKGYTIEARNWRHGHAEIDIIARQGDRIVFVEVTARSSTRYGYPEEAVSPEKEALLARAAEEYLQETDHQGPIRFDIISIVFSGNRCDIKHIEDAFYPTD